MNDNNKEQSANLNLVWKMASISLEIAQLCLKIAVSETCKSQHKVDAL